MEKKPKYIKPQITKVRLDAEVILKSNCKAAGGAGKAGRICTQGVGSCSNSVVGT